MPLLKNSRKGPLITLQPTLAAGETSLAFASVTVAGQVLSSEGNNSHYDALPSIEQLRTEAPHW
jgi:hypothetical protein